MRLVSTAAYDPAKSSVSKKPPLDHKDVIKGLQAAGFKLEPQKATSHQQWEKIITKNGKEHKLKVTVDKHHSPYTHNLVKSMASQAGMSERQFRQLCCKDGTKKAKRGLLDWLTNLYS